MTPDDFDALFDTITTSAFRFESLAVYAVDEEDSDVAAWREGRAMAERSVRTDPWLARIARQTIVDGIDWCRVRLVEHPLSWYLRFEVPGYVESQAAGERILLTDSRCGWEGGDFWLFDRGRPSAHAVLQSYDDTGSPTAFDHVTGSPMLAQMERATARLIQSGTVLNRWMVDNDAALRDGGRLA